MFPFGESCLIAGKVLTNGNSVHFIRLRKRFCGNNGDASMGNLGEGNGRKL